MIQSAITWARQDGAVLKASKHHHDGFWDFPALFRPMDLLALSRPPSLLIFPFPSFPFQLTEASWSEYGDRVGVSTSHIS